MKRIDSITLTLLAGLFLAGACASPQLLVCGSSMIYRVDARRALEDGKMDGAVLWSWDAREHGEEMGLAPRLCRYMAECKPIDGGRKILAVSSAGWCAVIDAESGEVGFRTTRAPMAHSAALLPGRRIAVACSVDPAGNAVKLYDERSDGAVLFSDSLYSAHGVVWSDRYQRLFAIGGTTLKVYRLKDWETAAPGLEVEQVVESPYVTHLHELSPVDDDTLFLGGDKGCLYHIGTGTFEPLPLFDASVQVKAVNIHPRKGMWFVDATAAEGEPWSSWTARFTKDYSDPDIATTLVPVPGRTFKVEGINMYKIRVYAW